MRLNLGYCWRGCLDLLGNHFCCCFYAQSSRLITFRIQVDYIIDIVDGCGWNADSFGFNLPLVCYISHHVVFWEIHSDWPPQTFQNPGGCCLIFAEISGGLKCKIPNLLISIVNQFPIWYQPQFVEIQKNGWRIHILIHWNIANLGCEAPKSFLLMLRAHPYNDFLGKHIPHYMFDVFTPTPQLDVSKD